MEIGIKAEDGLVNLRPETVKHQPLKEEQTDITMDGEEKVLRQPGSPQP